MGRRAMSWKLIHRVIRAISACENDNRIKGGSASIGLLDFGDSKAGRRKFRHRILESARKAPASAVCDWLMVEVMNFKHRHEIAFTQFFQAKFYRKVRKLEAFLDELFEEMEDDPLEIKSGLLYEALEPALEKVS